MSVSQNRISMIRLVGEVLFVSGGLPCDAACVNEVSASQAGGNVSELTIISSWGNESVEQASCLLPVDFLQAGSLFHSEFAFSFFDCTPVPQEPQITVLSDASNLSDYTLIAGAAQNFSGWITVTAYAVIRSVVQAFRRVVCEAKALFNRRAFIFQGGLRL